MTIGPGSHDYQASGQAPQIETRLPSSVLRMVVSVSKHMNPEHLVIAVFLVVYTGRASVDEQPNAMFGEDGHARLVETGSVVEFCAIRNGVRHKKWCHFSRIQMDGPCIEVGFLVVAL